ncbi:MAG: type II toxin-antitoxin system VapC family toxin [Nitrososphaerota archaeon]|nr:type II toxin-antitoxin system VapC family toxin [Nitrososphaerota archaeon]
MAEPVYLDSNVFILPLIHGDSGRGAPAARLLRKVEAGETTAYTSILTWDEVTWVVLKTLGRADSLQAGKKLLQFPNLRFIDVSEAVITRCQWLMEKYQIKPRDAVHCSSAIVKGIKSMVSDDRDFEIVRELKRTPLEKGV